MTKYYSFKNIHVGDTVRLSNPGRDDFDVDDVTFIVTSKYNTNNFGPVIEGSVEGENESFYQNDDWEIEVISYAHILPTTGYVTWEDENGSHHVAVQNPNGSWNADGETMPAATLKEKTAPYQLVALTKQR